MLWQLEFYYNRIFRPGYLPAGRSESDQSLIKRFFQINRRSDLSRSARQLVRNAITASHQ